MTLAQLAVAYRPLVTSAHAQIGRRAIADAKALADRNPARVEELRARAEFHLEYAKAFDRLYRNPKFPRPL